MQCTLIVNSAANDKECYLLDLNPNKSNIIRDSGFIKLITPSVFDGKRIISDFTGDGKADILVIKEDKTYKIVSFNQLVVAPWVELKVIGFGTLSVYDSRKQLLTGDYNGDGKTDLMIPQGDGSNDQKDNSNWHVLYANPKLDFGAFFDEKVYSITPYWSDSTDYYSLGRQFSSFYAIDTNKDGKTDLVKIWRNFYKPEWTINDHDTNWQVTTFANNIGFGSNTFSLDYITPCQGFGYFSNCAHWSDSPEMVTPIVASFKYNNLNNEIVLVRKHTSELTYINFSKDVSQDNTLKKVTQASGSIVDEFFYKPMQPETSNANNIGANTDYYSSENTLNYPYVEFKQLLSNKIVTQHSNTAMGITRHQDFKYCGLSVHLGGLGMLGFRKNARTNWYRGTTDKKIW